MSTRCLLCGYDVYSYCNYNGVYNPVCSKCSEAPADLQPDEIFALMQLGNIKPSFQICGYEGRCKQSTVRQPACLLTRFGLCIGDMDDAANTQRLRQLRIGCVINLCVERIHPNSPHAHVPSELAKQGIDQTILEANDSHDFDIIPVAEAAVGHIKARLNSAQK